MYGESILIQNDHKKFVFKIIKIRKNRLNKFKLLLYSKDFRHNKYI